MMKRHQNVLLLQIFQMCLLLIVQSEEIQNNSTDGNTTTQTVFNQNTQVRQPRQLAGIHYTVASDVQLHNIPAQPRDTSKGHVNPHSQPTKSSNVKADFISTAYKGPRYKPHELIAKGKAEKSKKGSFGDDPVRESNKQGHQSHREYPQKHFGRFGGGGSADAHKGGSYKGSVGHKQPPKAVQKRPIKGGQKDNKGGAGVQKGHKGSGGAGVQQTYKGSGGGGQKGYNGSGGGGQNSYKGSGGGGSQKGYKGNGGGGQKGYRGNGGGQIGFKGSGRGGHKNFLRNGGGGQNKYRNNFKGKRNPKRPNVGYRQKPRPGSAYRFGPKRKPQVSYSYRPPPTKGTRPRVVTPHAHTTTTEYKPSSPSSSYNTHPTKAVTINHPTTIHAAVVNTGEIPTHIPSSYAEPLPGQRQESLHVHNNRNVNITSSIPFQNTEQIQNGNIQPAVHASQNSIQHPNSGIRVNVFEPPTNIPLIPIPETIHRDVRNTHGPSHFGFGSSSSFPSYPPPAKVLPKPVNTYDVKSDSNDDPRQSRPTRLPDSDSRFPNNLYNNPHALLTEDPIRKPTDRSFFTSTPFVSIPSSDYPPFGDIFSHFDEVVRPK